MNWPLAYNSKDRAHTHLISNKREHTSGSLQNCSLPGCKTLLHESTTLKLSGAQTLRPCYTTTNRTTHVHPSRTHLLQSSKSKHPSSKSTDLKTHFCYPAA